MLTVREYLRVSRDALHTERSPDQQHAENVRAIAQQGWTLHLAPAYRDTDRSASRYAKKVREDFRRLIDDLESGEFGADILAIWESSRGSRRVGEWVDLVDLCKQRGVRIWVTTHARLYDPGNARDRRSLLEDAVDAEYESDKISERRRRSARASAEQGRPHGRNIYGYRRIYDERTRELVRVEAHPEQAPVVEEAARRVLHGDSFYSVARDFNARGIPTRRGKRTPPFENDGWTPSTVRQMLQIPSYAGKRDYKGIIVADGIWPALIPFEQWQQIQAIMGSASRKGPRDYTAKYLLTGIAVCGICGAKMKCCRNSYLPRRPAPDGSPQPRRVTFYYICAGVIGRKRDGLDTGFHAGMKAETLEETVVDLVLARLQQPAFPLTTDERAKSTHVHRVHLAAEIAEHEAYLDDVRADAAAARRFDLILDQEARVQPLINDARAKLAELAAIDPFVQGLAESQDIKSSWEALDIADQRRVIRAVVAPVVNRVSGEWRGRRAPNRERVEPQWV